METPPREKKGSAAVPPKQLHARLKMQMENETEVEGAASGNPEMERMGDEVPVHTNALKHVDDDFDDEDLA